MEPKDISFAFFGTGALAESVLSSLVKAGFIPKLVITKPDAPQGRHMELTAPHIKTWAIMKGIEVFQPLSLKDLPKDSPLHTAPFDIFVVASYGKIIPEDILFLPRKGVLNVHPSLLPLYRGPSPIESVLLDGHMTSGVSIMLLDKEMDHGPILVQNSFTISPLENAGTLEVRCGQLGGELLVSVLPHYLSGALTAKQQDHTKATVCKKITKDLGLIHLDDDIDLVRRKFRALNPWPTIYFFITHGDCDIRVKVTSLELVEEKESRRTQDYIISVIPEGKKEMDWESFKRGYMDSKGVVYSV
jgi:methionyl-tRNA formyltransferase